MSTTQPLPGVFHTPTSGEVLEVVGDRIRIFVDSKATNGACFIFEATTQPGAGPPLHRHGVDDEYFAVIEGTVKFVVDGKPQIVHAGGFAFAPRHSVHTFQNIGDKPSRMIITCVPGGLETPFRACDQLHKQGQLTPDKVTAVFEKFNLQVLGPPLSAL